MEKYRMSFVNSLLLSSSSSLLQLYPFYLQIRPAKRTHIPLYPSIDCTSYVPSHGNKASSVGPVEKFGLGMGMLLDKLFFKRHRGELPSQGLLANVN
jgi:hypothetical protein